MHSDPAYDPPRKYVYSLKITLGVPIALDCGALEDGERAHDSTCNVDH
jgi:hypothetical protein